MRKNMLKFKEFSLLLEALLPVEIDKQVVGTVDSGDESSINKIKRLAGSATDKQSIVSFLEGIGYPSVQANICFDDILSGPSSPKVAAYFAERTIILEKIIGKIQNGNTFNADLLGLDPKHSTLFWNFIWNTDPATGPSEAWMSAMIKDGRRPDTKEKGDVRVGNLEIEVKASGGRIKGSDGLGSNKQIPDHLKIALNNISNELKIKGFEVEDNRDPNKWNITTLKGGLLESNLQKLASLKPKGFDKKDKILISSEIVNAYGNLLLDFDMTKYQSILSDSIKDNGSLDVALFNTGLIELFYTHYYNRELFHYFCISNTENGNFLIIDPSPISFMAQLKNGNIKIKSAPSFKDSRANSFQIILAK